MVLGDVTAQIERVAFDGPFGTTGEIERAVDPVGIFERQKSRIERRVLERERQRCAARFAAADVVERLIDTVSRIGPAGTGEVPKIETQGRKIQPLSTADADVDA